MIFRKTDREREELLSASTVPGSTKRLNGMPIVLLAVLGVSLACVLGYVAYTRTEQAAVSSSEIEVKSSPAINYARELTEQSQGQAFTPPAPPELPKLEQMKTVAEKNDKGTPTLHVSRPLQPERVRLSADEEYVRNEKMRSLETALKSRTVVPIQSQSMEIQTSMRSDSRQTPLPTDPLAAYQARLQQISSMPSGGGMGSFSELPSSVSTSSASGRNDIRQFDRNNRWTLGNKVEAPGSPYIIRAGFVLPAIMISGISSDLPGQVMAQVSQNIYDSATGRFLLIPQGTRLVGTYASNVAYGQSRILMAWQRLIFPDGRTLDIEAMPGADQAGKSGFHDKVNNHYLRIFGSALLLSGVIAGVSLSQDTDNNDSDRQRASDALSEALGQTLGQAMSQMLQKNMSIAPTLEIRPGYRFNVMVTKDLTLPGCYRAFDY